MALESLRKASIRAVLFDAGNTLVHVRDSVGDVYAAVAGDFGASLEGETVDQHFRSVFEERRPSFLEEVSAPHTPERERRWWRALVVEVLRRAGGYDDLSASFDAYFDRLYREFERPEHWRLFPDVRPCLEGLRRRGVAAAVVSNWDSRLHTVLEGLGVAGAFRFVLTSAEFGAQKPDPSVFREAAARLELPPGRVLHVGDRWEDDVVGTREAGLQALWLRRNGTGACPPGVEWAADLRQVPERIAP